MQHYLEYLQAYGGRFVDGTLVTIQQTLLAALLAIFVAALFGMMRLSEKWLIRGTSIVYIEFFRGTSLLV